MDTTKYKIFASDVLGVDFNDLGLAFERNFPNEFNQVKLNNSFIKVIKVKPLINFARVWFKKKDKNNLQSLEL